jgi:2-isopropylmalate synthase
VLSGTTLIPTASVRMRRGEESLEASSIGDGPVDAVCRAIDRITGFPVRLTEYSLNAVTKGKDAMGEVLVQVEHKKRMYTGRAASTDVIEASAKAYLNAVNQAVFHHERSLTENV